MKKCLSVLISLLIVLSVAAPFNAWANENPLYEKSGVTEGLKGGNIIFIEDSVSGTYNGRTYYTKGLQLYQYAKKKLDARKENFNLYCLSKDELDIYSATNNITQMVFLGATDDELSVTSTDGDYIRWAVRSFETLKVIKDAKKNGYNYYTLKVRFLYYDTIKEEKKADSAINSFINSLKTSGKTDVEIIRAVHNYLCKINVYDYAAANDPYSHLYAFSSYGALLKGKCVCQGYAAAFYRICRELGYSVRFVGSDPDWGCHAWNIIRLDGSYYIIDCTWDDQIFDEDDVEIEPYYYFLTDYRSSRKYDNLGEHKLYSSLYETNYFETNYKQYFAEKPYFDIDEKRLSSCSVTLSDTAYVYSGAKNTPAITVKDGGEELTEGTDYTVSYSSNTNCGLARVDITGAGEYEGSSSHRLYTIKPQKITGLKVTSVTSSSASLSWNAVSGGVTGYEIQSLENGSWKTLGRTEETKFTASSLSAAAKKKLRVRAYKTVYKRNIYGTAAKVYCATKPKKSKITATKSASKSVKLTLKKQKCSGWQIKYADNKKMKNAKVITVSSSKLSKTVKKLKKGKTYYFRVRAFKKYKNENGKTKTVRGVWSEQISAKAK